MPPPSAVRSYVITLVIAITIIGPQASGFAISRNNNTSPSTIETQTRDLSSNETLKLHVKNDSKRLNDIIIGKDGDSNKTTKSNEINETIAEIIEKTYEVITKMSPSVAQTATKLRGTTEDTKISTIISDTVEVFDSVEDVTGHKYIDKTTDNNKDSIVMQNQLDLTQTVTSLLTTNTENSTETNLFTELSSVTDQTATESESTNDQSMRNSLGYSYENQKLTTKFNPINEMISDTLETSTSTRVPLIEETRAVSSTDLSPSISETSFSNMSLSKDSSEPTNESSVFSDSHLTVSTTDISKITEPLWKKYTTIIRKRVTSSEDAFHTARTEDESMKAETSNTYVDARFEKSVTSIPLEDMTVELQLYTNQSSTSGEIISQESVRTNLATESTTPYSNAIDYGNVIRTATAHTKRAGYLDNSEKILTPYVSSFPNIENKENGTETYGNVDDIDTKETEGPEVKKVSGPESQSQLAEDAIQEELMKEEAFNNNQDNANRYKDEKAESGGVKPLGPDAAYSLSVRPIHERTMTTLYTVSPNYKQMKKIDVQASKPFVRDPDDNSWRNESISSLGIVFKPKNSSKSFKEVLKNKTQTELNNLQEKDSIENVPGLRLRLEKIAEVRKTKKSKLNKDGEEIYTDYEESNSAERFHQKQKPDSIFSVFASVELPKTTSPSDSPPKVLEGTSPMDIWKEMEAVVKSASSQGSFDSLGVNPLTTLKPKKLLNIAEYYDTTDEYDADYVTMSKLDLKKFTVPKTTRPPVTYPIGPMPTRPTEAYPDRKPTVQYFPPRRPQNVNNLDDFERKLNGLTFKDSPETEPRPFVTTPPGRVATVHPGTHRAATPAKPPAFTMYIPNDLNEIYDSTNSPRKTTETRTLGDGAFDRGSYVIKHYRDFLDAAAKDEEDDRNSDYAPTESPRRATVSNSDGVTLRNDYDYVAQFHKEVFNRFVDNFNQNSERFKVDFPILFNSSVVHRPGSAAASSRVFLRRLYGEGTATQSAPARKPCEPACDVTVELSPAYELHYYVPGQEEKETAEPRAASKPQLPYRYRI